MMGEAIRKGLISTKPGHNHPLHDTTTTISTKDLKLLQTNWINLLISKKGQLEKWNKYLRF